MNSRYVLSKKNLKAIATKIRNVGPLRCELCGLLLQIGDSVISVSCNGRLRRFGFRSRKLFHESCWESRYYDTEKQEAGMVEQ